MNDNKKESGFVGGVLLRAAGTLLALIN
ncbi:hypothetical protein PPL_09757 [Heterostelium album PN500]|uniref:Uncharacterized protein n=1 Tax=Heterostelium pallidum (strain ATCC 26659 / Pp 5 / PN500) TaxID=670386 RepID=D3BNZ5_HETP5|nr:hypothetical protein PPL_09757 [Heterostelium album PN500]